MSGITAKALVQQLKEALLPKYDPRESENIARELLLHFAGIDRVQLSLNNSIELHSQLQKSLDEAVERLLNNEPLQHIIGEVEFFGLNFITDSRALIPRPETEELVDWIIKEEDRAELKAVDIGTGTGCIAICLARFLPKAQITAIDVSEEALALAEINAQKNDCRLTLVNSDILKAPLEGQFDLIVSNPPYIPEQDKAQMQPNVLDYEPVQALFVPDHDPLLFYRTIGQQAKQCLKPGGALYFEIHESYGGQTVDLLESLGFQVTLRKDMQDKDRMIKAVLI